jgi:hypothetical protein
MIAHQRTRSFFSSDIHATVSSSIATSYRLSGILGATSTTLHPKQRRRGRKGRRGENQRKKN